MYNKVEKNVLKQSLKRRKTMKLGNKIRQMRSNVGYTQERLASLIGVSAQAISKWENEISMPDITLLPNIAEVFGISIDELFDLTVEQKMKRIDNRLEIVEELSPETFKEYEIFLNEQLQAGADRCSVLTLLANLYHHRMEADSRRVSKYGREAILLDPAQKKCQWMLSKAEGQAIWDWNVANHSSAIDFYKRAIEADKETPKSSMSYYYLLDNLLADNRTKEAKEYLDAFSKLPSANPVMIESYEAYIALLEHDVEKADAIIASYETNHSDDPIYIFEAAQYYARKCDYAKAIELYERYWDMEKPPRFTDPMQAVAVIYGILGKKDMAIKAYDRLLDCLRDEWGYSKEDKPYIEAEREKMAILSEK